MTRRIAQRGFGAVMAIMVLVALGAMAAGIVKFGSLQALNMSQDIESARAWQAAKAGTEWGLFQVLQPTGIWRTAAACNAVTASAVTLDLSAQSGFWVSIRCQANSGNSADYTELTRDPAVKVRSYVVTATACNVPGGCPNSAAAVTPDYVERVRTASAFCQDC